jgi:ABC-type transport system involved in cytochrome c biogenesis permease component
VGVLLSVYTRYGGMLLAVAFMWFMAPMIFFTLVAALAVIAGNSGWMDELMQWIVPLLLIPLTIGLCAATYWPILRRMESLGSR